MRLWLRVGLLRIVAASLVCVLMFSAVSLAQKKAKPRTVPVRVNELTKLRDDFIKATKEYKTSLEKLLTIYESNVKKAEDKLAVSRKLFNEGLVAKNKLENSECALAAEKDRVVETTRQMTVAETQFADILVEGQTEEQL